MKEVDQKLTYQIEPIFRPFYELLEEMETIEEEKPEGKRITLSTKSMKMTEFLRFIADNAGISIVCDQSLDSNVVNINVVDTEVRDVLSAVARRYGVDITEQGNVYYFGALKPQDRAILVRKVKRLSSDEIIAMVQTLSSEVGRVALRAMA